MRSLNKKKKFFLVAFSLILVASPNLAFASVSTIGEMAGIVESNIKAIKSTMLSVFYMIGLVLVGAGLFNIYKDQKQPNQGHAKNGMISFLIGVLMLLIPSMIGILATTVGADAEVAKGALKSDKGF